MARSIEYDEPIHPDDEAFLNRREAIQKGLKIATGVGFGAAFGAIGHIFYQAYQNGDELAAVRQSHPEPSEEAVTEAAKTHAEQTTHQDLPERKVQWAQDQLDQKKAHDEEFARKLPHGTVPWVETDKKVIIGGMALTMVSFPAEMIIETKTRKELSRRNLFRYKAELSSQIESGNQQTQTRPNK